MKQAVMFYTKRKKANEMTFTQWLKQEHGQNWQGIHMDLIEEGYTEDQLNDRYHELRCLFDEYLDENNLEEEHE